MQQTMPYKRDRSFDISPTTENSIPKPKQLKCDFWDKIAQMPYNPDPKKQAQLYKDFDSHGHEHPLIKKFISINSEEQKYKTPSSIVDLGAAQGHNIDDLAMDGQKVLAIEQSLSHIKLMSEVFENYPNVKLVHKDILLCSTFGTKHDLAICTDVLQYIPPKNLQDLLLKISRCVSIGGHFLGSILLYPTPEDDEEYGIDGINVYKTDNPKAFITQMLKTMGFVLKEGPLQLDEHREINYSFIAQKVKQV